MNLRIFSVATLLVCVVASVLATGPAIAADSKTVTVIAIEGMHCESCAKKVVQKLQAVQHVASVKIDVKTGKASVLPAQGKTVSVKALWTAVEAAGYTPTKLAGPGGTYTEKPKS